MRRNVSGGPKCGTLIKTFFFATRTSSDREAASPDADVSFCGTAKLGAAPTGNSPKAIGTDWFTFDTGCSVRSRWARFGLSDDAKTSARLPRTIVRSFAVETQAIGVDE